MLHSKKRNFIATCTITLAVVAVFVLPFSHLNVYSQELAEADYPEVIKNTTSTNTENVDGSESSHDDIPAISNMEITEEGSSIENEEKTPSADMIVTYDNLENLRKDLNGIVEDANISMKIVDTITDLQIARIEVGGIEKEEAQEKLEKKNSVIRAEENLSRSGAFIPNDSGFSKQWAHRNTGQKVNGVKGVSGVDIGTDQAWNAESSSGSQIIVAVIDTGVDYNHSDLAGNMWNGSGGCKNDLGNTISGGCPHHGWNYENNNNNPIDSGQANPAYTGHGTFTASQIAAITNNSNGISSASRYNTIKIMALRFNFDVFSGVKAINFAKNNGAKVINASFGGSGYSQIEADAIAAFPGVFVTAAGNGGGDSIGDNIDSTGFYPCAYTESNIICVAASNQNDTLASFSNYGNTSVDIAAPGVNLYGIYRGAYIYGNGTSFASPLVAGAVALMYKKLPSISQSEIITNIKKSGTYVSSFSGKIASSRRLNTNTALQITGTPDVGPVGTTPIYRLYNTRTGVHLYTRGIDDRNKVLSKWSDFEFTDSGPAWYASLTNDGTTPIYRLYNTRTGVHLYTRGEADRDKVLSKWSDFEFTDSGPAWYAALS